jgi:heme/copper-type cytochrome/quinol oxidase subunit 2
MTSTLLRYTLSIGLGIALAASLLGMSQVIAPQIANAQPLDAEDLFGGEDSTFSDSAGLGEADLESTIANLIRVVLGFLGIIAVVIVLMGGFKWMTAGGNDEKVAEAKRLLIAGVIGMAIILSAYAITTFVLSSLLEASA